MQFSTLISLEDFVRKCVKIIGQAVETPLSYLKPYVNY